MATELAKAYVQIIPSAVGIKGSLSSVLDDEAESAGRSAGGKLSSALGGAVKAAAAGITAATAALTAFAGESVKVGAGFDQSMSQVAATMGVTVDSIQNLREFAQEMGSTTAFSASQAADALNFMALAGYDAETSMEMLPNVLNLAAAGGIELAAASDMVTDAQSALGISLDETAELVDKMAKASSKSNTSVAQLGEAILTVGGTAKDLAGGTSELSTALGILADSGVKGSEGGTALRNIILAMTPTTNAAVAAFEKLGLESYDANGNLRPLSDTFRDLSSTLSSMTGKERATILNDIFNKVDLKSVNALLAASGDMVSSVASALGEADVEWGRYADTAEGAEQRIQEWGNIALQLLTEVGLSAEEAADAMSFDYDIDAEDALKIINTVTETIENQSDRWDELTGYINDANGAAAQMAETQLDNLNGDITLFQSALEGAQIAISEGLMPNLREFVQFGSAGVSTLTEAFKEGGLSGAMDALGDVLSDGLAMVFDTLPELVAAGGELLISLTQGIIQNLPILIEGTGQVVGALWDSLKEATPDLLAAGADLLSFIVNGILEGLPQLAESAVALMSNLGEYLKENLPTLIEAGLQTIKELTASFRENAAVIVDGAIALALALGQGLIDAIPAIVENVPEIVSNVANVINDNAPKVLKAGWELIKALVKGLIEAIPVIIGEMPKIIAAIWDTIEAINWVNLGGKIVDFLSKGIKGMLSSVLDAAKKIVSTIIDGGGLKNLPQMAIQWGEDMLSNFIEGIKSKISEVKDTVLGVAQMVKDFLGFSEPEEGPLSNFHTFAPDMMELYAAGIKENLGIVEHAVSDAASSIYTGWSEESVKRVTGIWKDINDLEENYAKQLKSRTQQIFNSYKLFDQVPERQKVNGQELINNLKGQISTIEEFYSGLQELAARGVGEELVEDIRAMGPSAVDQLSALLALSEDKLDEYAALYAEKQELANGVALEELQNLREETDRQIQENIDSLSEIFDSVVEQSEGWGTDLMQNFIDGIESMKERLASVASNVAQTVKDYLGFSEPEEGPLSNFHTFAPDMMELYAAGIKENLGIVERAAEDAANAARAGWSSPAEASPAPYPTTDSGEIVTAIMTAAGQIVAAIQSAGGSADWDSVARVLWEPLQRQNTLHGEALVSFS